MQYPKAKINFLDNIDPTLCTLVLLVCTKVVEMGDVPRLLRRAQRGRLLLLIEPAMDNSLLLALVKMADVRKGLVHPMAIPPLHLIGSKTSPAHRQVE